MAIATWTDSLVKVHKTQEESCKSQLASIHKEMLQVQLKIEVVTTQLAQEEGKAHQLFAKPVSPQLISQIAVYCQSLQQTVASCWQALQQLKHNEHNLCEQLKNIAEKRILLEKLQQKLVAQAVVKQLHHEELFLNEMAQAQYVEADFIAEAGHVVEGDKYET